MSDNFRGLKRVIMVTVCEGDGIESDPSRLVHYIYDGDQLVGQIDIKTDFKFSLEIPPPSELTASAPEPKSKTTGRERLRELNAKKRADNPDADDGTNDLIEMKINDGMKPKLIAKDLGVNIQKVYNQKMVMKKEGRLKVSKWPKETVEEVLALAADHKDSLTISIQLGLEVEEVKEIIKQNY